ncbi:MAG TPA: alpha-(1-_3)-arabinofuranosyltransferase family protein [Acidimicrobiales bacterium]|nr:alpha-(1->3)-arabinofuranosyltransferase family protein [Acidimicrobiales bacterium]
MTAVILEEQGQLEGESDETVQIPRGVLGAFSAGIAALCFLQAPGRIVADTKLDIAVAPLTFLGHALHLWSPQQAFGGVAYQAYGYFLPMGPFFAMGHVLGLPTWVIQRLWVALLLIVGFWGLVRLAEVLDVGSPRSRLVAALAYVFMSPITLLGAVTAYILPFSLLPWAVIPLARGIRGGSTRLAACRSGLAVLLIGGTNAAAVVTVLPLPFLYLLTRTPGKRRRQLLEWWILAVFLACAWWAGSLLLEARYGFNQLPFTELSGTTTAVSSLFDLLRGNSYWVAFDQLGPTSIKSGLEAVTSPLMILAGGFLGALGLYGLAHRQMKERTWLVASLALGVVFVGAGYSGHLGAPFSDPVGTALNGPLALFRNVWKFQPLINLPLALGLAHAVHTLSARRAALTGSLRSWASGTRVVVIPLAAVAVAGAAIPFITDNFFPSESFANVPSYWQSTATWLNSHAGRTTSLLVPGSSVGYYTWGSPLDEPMQWLSSANWAVRGLIPDSSEGNIEVLDAVDHILQGGEPNSGLSAFLAQSGVRYVVERNDLGPEVGAPSPLEVHDVLSKTPGLKRVAAFGPRQVARFGALRTSLPAVEVYAVHRTVSPVNMAPVGGSLVVSGGPQALLALDQLGLDPGNRAVVLAGDGRQNAKGQTWVVSDTAPRTDVQFGSIWDNETYVLNRTEPSPVTGKPPTSWTIVTGSEHQTVASFIGAASISASSFGSTNLIQLPENQPAAAMDGERDTAWIANAANDSVGQWIRVDLRHVVTVPFIGLALNSSPQNPRVTQITIATARGTLRERVNPTATNQLVRVPPGATRWFKITFTKVSPPLRPGAYPVGAGIVELKIPGVTVQKAEVVPADERGQFARSGTRSPLYVFTSPVPGHAAGVASGGEDQEPRMVRIFTSPKAGSVNVRGLVTPRPGLDLASAIGSLGLHALTSQPFHLACGQGPVISIDGRKLATEVNGTDEALGGYGELQFAVCGPNAPVDLTPGTHVFEGNAGGFLKVNAVALIPSSTPAYAATQRGRSVSVVSWGPDRRSVVVGGGGSSYLIVHQNFNAGWTAELGNRTLQSARINGWQQAWVVPAGSGGVVTLTYTPDGLYQIGLVIGLALACLLVALALWPAKRENDARARGARADLPAALAIGAALVVLIIVAGALAVIFPVLLLLAWLVRSGRWLSVLAGASFLAAGVAAAIHIGRFPASDVGVFGWPAQVASAIALAAVFSSVVVHSSRWTRKAGDAPVTNRREQGDQGVPAQARHASRS